jgi:UDP-2-acetamido-3-amino-2,3-dideoxy-glucuronate N-acetyltransferase
MRNIYNSTIGENCKIANFVEIGGSTIGNNCSIQAFSYICPEVTIEDDVFIGPHVCFTNVINPRSFISRKEEFKPTLIKQGATIGANSTIICGVTIGQYAMIGAGSVVTKDVEPYCLYYGNPAKYIRKINKNGEL